jgi:putative ABC transport system permease protein
MQAGLLGRSLVNLLQADPGFETRETMAIGLSLPQATFDRVIEQAAVLDAVFAEISRVPGVVAVGSISDFPMSGAINSTITPVVGVADSKPRVLVRAIDGDYFGAMRIPVLRGRPFSAADRTGGAPVAMVNEAFARSQFADQDPIGRHVLVRGITREIVGVVRSVKEFRPTGGGDLTLYTPFRQEAENWMRTGVTVVVRADGPGLTVAGGVRQATARAAPGRPAGAPRAVTDYVERHLAVPRLQAIVIGTFAMTAIVLAAIGLGGVLACAVAERWREMAVRMSMGARPADIARLIVGQSMWLTAIGLALGVVAGSMLSGLVAGSLHGVETGDVPVTLAAVGVLFGAALVASWVPARRASRVNPIEALRG